MSYKDTIKDSFKILTFDDKTIKKISNETNATKYGFYTLLISGLATGISSFNFFTLILSPIVTVIGFIIGYSIYHFIAKFIFKGRATGSQYFRTLSNSFVIYWFTFIPFLGQVLQFIAGIYLLIINAVILNKVHKLSMIASILLSVIPLIIAFIIFIAAIFFVIDPGFINPKII